MRKYFEEVELNLPIDTTPMETNWPEKGVNLASVTYTQGLPSTHCKKVQIPVDKGRKRVAELVKAI